MDPCPEPGINISQGALVSVRQTNLLILANHQIKDDFSAVFLPHNISSGFAGAYFGIKFQMAKNQLGHKIKHYENAVNLNPENTNAQNQNTKTESKRIRAMFMRQLTS